ncbi:DUF4865 family protein [Celerinatantimonas sp. YJH-8]|uniref:DUF4865 family protein n=1 Tax=Celerinatantimonas sp. YJH-8 TaxID=3228714 RepID=UPI0038C97C93
MIAMQYSFTLPADYEMQRIEDRIRLQGAKLDGFAHLALKLYLYARADDPECRSSHNLYAPFYLWYESAGMNQFLACDGFKALCQQFGRPAIDIWIPTQASLEQLSQCPVITRCIEAADEPASIESPLCTAHDYHTWRTLRLTADESQQHLKANQQHYRIGYIAQG